MWVKLDDHFVDHPKILAAGPLAGWLFVAGLCYANRLLTDGFIPENNVTRLVTPNGHGNGIKLAQKLCAVGLWRSVVIDGVKGYQVHDFLKYQPSKKQVLHQRKQASTRKSRSRHGVTNPVTKMSRSMSRVSHAAPDPDPDPSTKRREEGAPARPSDLNAGRTQDQRRRVAPDGRAKRAASAPVDDALVTPEQAALLRRHGFGGTK